MSMSSKFLAVLIIRCEDPHRVAAFYQEVLGLPLERRSDDEFACLLGATRFGIHKLQPAQAATTNAEVGFHVPDLDRLVKALERKKVRLKDPIKDYPWARSATVLDPLGNSIYLMQIPDRSIEGIKDQLARDFSL
jgi:predicted enzyme related to lactoylglutathione lyase